METHLNHWKYICNHPYTLSPYNKRKIRLAQEPRRGGSVDEGVGHPRVAGAEVCGGLGALVIVRSTLEG
jgi:hypothetical protein